ncbi:RTA1 like protein-domain-containing protein [Mrakia frigida]|uniref:RTA1 domain-containing protein n=1 Tax=Mrakia frigida TaxID=29902 RepID=UPI003FCC0E44
MAFANSSSLLLNPNQGSPNLLSGKVEFFNYGYNMSMPTAACFTILFALSMLIHLFQAIKSKYYFLLWTLVLGTFIEMLGWACRAWSASSTRWAEEAGGYWNSSDDAFLAQITTLIIAPAFLQASLYILFGRIVGRLGPAFCRLSPRDYTWIFVSGDFVSLCIQGVGGGVASTATDEDGANQGARIMVGGVIVQMVVMVGFSALFVEFVWRYLIDRPVDQVHPFAWSRKAREVVAVDKTFAVRTFTISTTNEKRARLMLGALAGATFMIFIRSIYRTVELLDGWTGPIITNQTLFGVLDGGMIIIAVVLLNVLHPIFLLKEYAPQTVLSSELELSQYKE